MECYSQERIIAEIAKCDVVCRKCHQDKHRYVEGIKVILIPIPIYIPINIDPHALLAQSGRIKFNNITKLMTE